MKIIDQFRHKELAASLVRQIHQEAKGDYTFMEVCGGHTMAIQQFGIPSLLPPGIRLLSGPGCPVCVTARNYVDEAILLAERTGVLLATYGDLLRVPGSKGSLEQSRAEGALVRVIYSPLDVLKLARENPHLQVIFLAIGFETTAPGNGIALMEAQNQGLKNFFMLSAQKVMPPAMQAVVQEGSGVQGFICPGHVSTITGSGIFEFLPRDYGIACVISGFEPVDLLLSILLLIRQINHSQPRIEVQYARAVKPEGNLKAQAVIDRAFDLTPSWWRGFGTISDSGLAPKPSLADWDAQRVFDIQFQEKEDEGLCRCADILRGSAKPFECPLFGLDCTPANPIGACMVSPEGACAASYKYQNYGR
jgi:hydrogenase expression/formation protein HypD